MALVQENRWEARPKLAALLKVVIYIGPLVAGAVAALLASRTIQSQNPDWSWLLVSLLTMPISLAVIIAGERMLRRLLPLALLLKLSLLFPDQVPSRLGAALRAASPRRLLAKLEADDLQEVTVAERVITLAAALNAHDRRTRGHSERVRALTMLVADEMNIDGADRDKLEWAALLHDLGKLDVPSEILNKKGRPSEEEWLILREHPGAGPAHASDLADWLGEWIHAVDQHHERFDGTGYPLGLEAESIALSGRIVAVADAFEVMTAIRSYKVPMSTQAARDELVTCSGSHFDPAVVRSFMTVSLGDIHRALGPTSWIASLPFSGVAVPIATVGNALVGGSVTPALAAAAAVALLTGSAVHAPPAASQSSVLGEPVAVTQVRESIDSGDADAARSGLVNGVSIADGLDGTRPSFNGTALTIGSQDTSDDEETSVIPPDLPDSPDVVEISVPTLPPLPPTPIDDVVDDVIDVVDPVVGVVEDVVDPVVGVVEDVVDPVVGVVEDVVDPVVGVVEDVVDPVPGPSEPIEELLRTVPETPAPEPEPTPTIPLFG